MSNLDSLKDPFEDEVKNILGEESDENEDESVEMTSEALKTEEVNINESVEMTSEALKTEEVNINVDNPKKESEKPDYIPICVDFPKHATPVECIITATGYHDKIAASGRELRLLQNRLYMIPVDCNKEINSDEWSDIKVMSDMSSLIDVRYVKDGFACVMPLTHNIKIRQGNRLAILW